MLIKGLLCTQKEKKTSLYKITNLKLEFYKIILLKHIKNQ